MASQSTSVSASPGPSTKRQRTSSPSAPAAVPTRSERWWLADGNVILQAESTVFKVHKSVVSRAEVLKDTLDVGSVMAQETNGRGMSDGEELPTISLHDRAKDVDVLLRAIYDGISFVEKPPNMLELRALLLLADKYNHSTIFSMALKAFKTAVASQRRDWLDLFPLSSNRQAHDVRQSSSVAFDEDLFATPPDSIIALVSIAVECRLDAAEELSILYTLLAEQKAKGRTDMLYRLFDVDGLSIGLDRTSLKEIHSRLDQTAAFLDKIRLGSYRPGSHTLTCRPNPSAKESNGCVTSLQELMESLTRLHAHNVFTGTSSVRESIETALRKTTEENCAKFYVTSPGNMQPDCVELLRSYWRRMLVEYELEMQKGCAA